MAVPRRNTRASMRLYSAKAGGARERSASDLALLLFTLAPTLLLGLIAVPESGFERAVSAFVAAVPRGLDIIWRLGIAGLGLWVVTVLIGAALLRRWGVLVEIGLSMIVGLGFAMIASLRVNRSWPSVDQIVTGGAHGAVPLALLAVAASLSSAAGPHLTKPARIGGRWSVFVGAASAVLLGLTTPAGGLISVLLGVAAAASAHLGLGTSTGRPTVEEATAALRALGLEVTALTSSPRQSSGIVEMNGIGADREPMRVKVYGRDARDAQLLNAMWRRAWYSNDTSFSGSRERQVEHEAFITLLAAASEAGVPDVVAAGMTVQRDAIIALRGAGRPLTNLVSLDATQVVPQLWELIHQLHNARIVHGDLSLDSFGSVDGTVVLAELAPATMSISDDERTTDLAQLSCITAALVGVDAAVGIVTEQLGPAGIEAVLPYLQVPALSRESRRSIKTADIDLGQFRTALAGAAEVEPPESAKLRRVSPKSIAMVGLIAFVAFSLISTFGNIDLAELADLLADMSPGWAFAALCVAQLVYVPQAIAIRGASPKEVSLGPLTMLQASVAFIALAVPSTAGRLALNVRFFQRQGMTAPTALSVGAIDGFSGFLVQITVLLLTLVVGVGQVDLTLDISGSSKLGWIPIALGVVAVCIVVAVVVAVAVPQLRTRIADRVRPVVADARLTLSSLQSPAKLAQLFGGNLLSELILAAALGLSLGAFGASANLATLLVISIGAALFGGFMPVPGGIGVMEAALATGLAATGIDASTAMATALLFRATTYYLPPLWGWMAMRWLQRNSFL